MEIGNRLRQRRQAMGVFLGIGDHPVDGVAFLLIGEPVRCGEHDLCLFLLPALTNPGGSKAVILWVTTPPAF